MQTKKAKSQLPEISKNNAVSVLALVKEAMGKCQTEAGETFQSLRADKKPPLPEEGDSLVKVAPRRLGAILFLGKISPIMFTNV